MKVYILFAMILLSCSSENKKIFIKSLNAGASKRVDWYFYSLPTNFSKSCIRVSQINDAATIFESFFVSDISLNADMLTVQLYKNEYKIDSTALLEKGLQITVDTTGAIWNQASSRLGRLQRKRVNYFQPHFEDTYCPNGECY